MKKALRKAADAWITRFTDVPASVIEKMARADAAMCEYESNSLRLAASPVAICEMCQHAYDGLLSVKEPIGRSGSIDLFVPCENCGSDFGWVDGEPSTFPCGWSTLFAPPSGDHGWFLDNKQAIAKLGFFVFESEDYGVLLGIDAAGFDFYEAYWTPLYQLRWSRRVAGDMSR